MRGLMEFDLSCRLRWMVWKLAVCVAAASQERGGAGRGAKLKTESTSCFSPFFNFYPNAMRIIDSLTGRRLAKTWDNVTMDQGNTMQFFWQFLIHSGLWFESRFLISSLKPGLIIELHLVWSLTCRDMWNVEHRWENVILLPSPFLDIAKMVNEHCSWPVLKAINIYHPKLLHNMSIFNVQSLFTVWLWQTKF